MVQINKHIQINKTEKKKKNAAGNDRSNRGSACLKSSKQMEKVAWDEGGN